MKASVSVVLLSSVSAICDGTASREKRVVRFLSAVSELCVVRQTKANFALLTKAFVGTVKRVAKSSHVLNIVPAGARDA